MEIKHMLFPIGDDNSDRTRTPYVNYILIVINVLVYFLLQRTAESEFTYAYATVPLEILTGEDVAVTQVINDPLTGQDILIPLQPTPIPVWFTLITSMFMHGGIMHLAGNMLYLWIFGDNLENKLGHFRYLMFYLVTGILASLAHVYTTKYMGDSLIIPSLGASGAISGVLGGYLLLFPRRRVTVIIIRFITKVSAIVAIGIWIVFQVISGLGMLGGEASGVAYAAHIGGFIAGLVLIKMFVPPDKRIL